MNRWARAVIVVAVAVAVTVVGGFVWRDHLQGLGHRLDGAEAVLVIQGPDTQLDAPVDLGELWPPSWEGADPTVLLEHIYAAASAGNFADGSPYDRYGLADPALAPDRVWVPPYEHLVTWLEPGGIRVVVLSQGLTAEGVVAFSERYREVAQ